ncbi:MAG: DUF4417 domain-containing protein [Lachnospiraceae bacterium]|nr:DUF4417 domain-containing protein [Lachnospiraceae bacterium]
MSKRSLNIIDDGYHPELVEQALFDGSIEIPIITAPKEIRIPKSLTPFSKRNYAESFDTAICEYEHDVRFSELIYSTESLTEDLLQYAAFITPDCSLYRDMPLCLQIANTYFNRAVGAYLQAMGMYVITNIRWGDERSYTTCELPEKFAFLGAPKKSIVSVGTYGCIHGAENRYHFKAGLEAMLQELEPQVVLVYGPMPEDIFGDYKRAAKFVVYEDWISRKKGGSSHGNN